MTVTQIPIWLDCDPGHDDMIAILLSCFHPNFKLLGISTTFGNSSCENTTNNTLSILTKFQKRGVPVYQGWKVPLIKKPSFAPSIHGKSGLAGTELPTPQTSIENPSRDEKEQIEQFYSYLKTQVEKYENEISIVATGPLTNIGNFFQKYPDLKEKVKFVSIMGGGIEISNWKAGEFNIWCDPHSANFIFQDPIIAPKTILLPIDVTHTAILSESVEKQILNEPNTTLLRKMLYELMVFFKDTYVKEQGFVDGPPIHDPLAVIVLLEEYGVENMGIESIRYQLDTVEEGELEGKLEYKPDDRGVKVVTKLDIGKFWEIILKVITIADGDHTAEC